MEEAKESSPPGSSWFQDVKPLLYVVGGVVLLGALFVWQTSGSHGHPRPGISLQSIHDLRAALAQYEYERGGYPPSGNANLVAALSMTTKDGSNAYMEFEPEQMVAVGGERRFRDPWGNDFVYLHLSAPDSKGREYYIYSFGANGKDDTDKNGDGILSESERDGNKGDDIFSW